MIDAFLVGTTDDPVDHDHAPNAVRLEEEDDLLEDRRILAHIIVHHEVAPEVRRGSSSFAITAATSFVARRSSGP